MIRAMVLAQGWEIRDDNELIVPKGATLKMKVPTEILPVCPVCSKPLTMNLRSDDKFVEDEGWHQAADRYENFLHTRGGKVLYLELGVGYNTLQVRTRQRDGGSYAFGDVQGVGPRRSDEVYRPGLMERGGKREAQGRCGHLSIQDGDSVGRQPRVRRHGQSGLRHRHADGQRIRRQ